MSGPRICPSLLCWCHQAESPQPGAVCLLVRDSIDWAWRLSAGGRNSWQSLFHLKHLFSHMSGEPDHSLISPADVCGHDSPCTWCWGPAASCPQGTCISAQRGRDTPAKRKQRPSLISGSDTDMQHAHVQTYTCTHAYRHACVHRHAHTCTHVLAHTHAHRHMFTHTQTHVHTHKCK